MLSKFYNLIKNHVVTKVIFILATFLITFSMLSYIKGLAQFLIFAVLMESTALLLSLIALWIYSNFKFTKELSAGKDLNFTIHERNAFQRVVASTITAVHIVIGICVLTMYSGVFIQ